MFIKSLIISTDSKIIREINFRMGINLIIDESDGDVTGNNIGKTTVLKLIDFCFGAAKKNIWEDPENKKEIYKLVKDYLVENNVKVELYLKDNLNISNSKEIHIERNFLARTKIIRRINGENLTEDEFETELRKLIFPEHTSLKPTLRQIISHNIRYKDLSINNTLKTLDKFSSNVEYETLHLFLLGCEFNSGNNKQELIQKIKQETTFKSRLEKFQTKSAYETILSLIDMDIEELNQKKESFNINKNFEKDLEQLNQIKYQINKISSNINKLSLRKEIIIETEKELTKEVSKIDIDQLELIYEQATDKLDSIHKSFEDLVNYHNKMIEEKVKFISQELPSLNEKIEINKSKLNELLSIEKEQTKLVSKGDSFEELESIISELTEKYRKKGEFENIVDQLKEVENNIKSYNKELTLIDDELFTDDFENTVKSQLAKFNKHFSAISNYLYNEQYALKYDIRTNRKGQKLYKFSAFNTNFSSGKKQGEISCFDIAYTLFADEENIPCMHFLLNDKKELMHDNQLVKIANLVNQSNIQFVASILKDKLPNELNNEDYFIVKLSENDKLFRIENG